MFKLRKKLKVFLSFILIFNLLISFNINVSASSINYLYGVNTSNADGITTSFRLNSNPSSNTPNKGYISNSVLGSLSPTSDGFKIIILNSGIDKISSLSFTLKLYDVNNNLINSIVKSYTNLETGLTSYIWSVKKTSVQEKILMNGNWQDGKEFGNWNTMTYRYNFAGGQYGTMLTYGGQRHHIPSDVISPLSSYKGPCIRMVIADHKKTASYGSSTSAKQFRSKELSLIQQGKFLGAQQLGINDIKGLFGSKYTYAINDMVLYTKSLGYTK